MDEGAWKAAVHRVTEGLTQLSDFTFTFHFHALEKEMATHSSVFAWRIPGTGEPGGLPSTGSHRVRHDWSDAAAAAAGSISGTLCTNLTWMLNTWNRALIGLENRKCPMESYTSSVLLSLNFVLYPSPIIPLSHLLPQFNFCNSSCPHLMSFTCVLHSAWRTLSLFFPFSSDSSFTILILSHL